MLTRLVLFCSGLVFFRVLTSSRVCSATSTDSPPRFPNEISMTSLQLVTSPQSQSQSASSLFPLSPSSSPCSLQKQELDIQSHFILTAENLERYCRCRRSHPTNLSDPSFSRALASSLQAIVRVVVFSALVSSFPLSLVFPSLCGLCARFL